jgi:hypothetical protein
MSLQPTSQTQDALPDQKYEGPAGQTALAAGWKLVEETSDVSRKVITSLFLRLSEIPGSEAAGGTLGAEVAAYHQVIREVGDEFEAVTRIIDSDAAVLLFASAPAERAPALRGIEAALVLRERLEALNRRRRTEQEVPFRIGIGVHTGPAGAEEEGHQQRLMALHHAIRDAESLSLLNWQTPFPAIFLSKSALQGMGLSNGYQIQNLGEAYAPNRAKAIAVYALMNPHRKRT